MDKIKKKELRKFYLRKRNSLTNRKKSNSKINLKILNFFKNMEHKTISGYCSVNGEVDPSLSLNTLSESGHSICLPIIVDKNKKLIFKYWNKKTPMEMGKFGILVPKSDEVKTPNYLLIPTLSFDMSKNRLGYGGGYYDRTLEYLKNKTNCFAIGLAFDEQLSQKLPTEKFDQKLDLIITQSMIVK